MSRLNRALTIVLAILILAVAGVIVYLVVTPGPEDTFTEFYILGSDGQAGGYPKQVRVGEEASLVLVIVNREHDANTYQVEIRTGASVIERLEPIALEPQGKFEKPVDFTLDIPGEGQKLEFLLFKEGHQGVYESLHLWLDVVE